MNDTDYILKALMALDKEMFSLLSVDELDEKQAIKFAYYLYLCGDELTETAKEYAHHKLKRVNWV